MERANKREPLLTIVTVDKPKMLIGLNQKVRDRYSRSALGCRRHHGHRWTGGALPIRVWTGNVVSPSSSLWDSTAQAMPMGRRVDEAGKSEGQPVIGWIWVGTGPATKVG